MTGSEDVEHLGRTQQDNELSRRVLVGAGRVAQPASCAQAEYVDIRDDRVQRYFSLRPARVDLLRDAAECRLSGPVLSTRRAASRPCTTPSSTRGSRASGCEVVPRNVSRGTANAAARAAALLAAVGCWRWRGGVGSGACCRSRCSTQPLSYVLEARDGTLLSARIASDGQWRFPPRAQVPEKFRRALLVFEDKRFEEHIGVDPLAMARALKLNLQRRARGERRQHA